MRVGRILAVVLLQNRGIIAMVFTCWDHGLFISTGISRVAPLLTRIVEQLRVLADAKHRRMPRFILLRLLLRLLILVVDPVAEIITVQGIRIFVLVDHLEILILVGGWSRLFGFFVGTDILKSFQLRHSSDSRLVKSFIRGLVVVLPILEALFDHFPVHVPLTGAGSLLVVEESLRDLPTACLLLLVHVLSLNVWATAHQTLLAADEKVVAVEGISINA